MGRVPYPTLPDDHPDNRTTEGVNRWPPGQVRLQPCPAARETQQCCPGIRPSAAHAVLAKLWFGGSARDLHTCHSSPPAA